MAIGYDFFFLDWKRSIAMVLIAIVIFSFYEKGEPLQMLIALKGRQNVFKAKSKHSSVVIFNIDAAIGSNIFHFSQLPLVYCRIIFVVLFNLLLYAIFTKYAFYTPNSKSGAAGFFQALGATAIFVPVLLPVIWLLIIRFYFRSLKQLNPYLHDFD
jgi:uncharacterized membrane protein YhdT